MTKQTFKKSIITILSLAVILGLFSLASAEKVQLKSDFNINIEPNYSIMKAEEGENYLYKNENPNFQVFLGDSENVGNPKIVYQFRESRGLTSRSGAGGGLTSTNGSISFWLDNSLSGAPSLETVVGEKPKLIYRDIAPNIDLKYQIDKGRGVKEEIVLKSAPRGQTSSRSTSSSRSDLLPQTSNPNTFIFTAKTSAGIQIDRNLEGLWYFTDADGNYLFHFEKPFMIDAEGERSNNVVMDIEAISKEKTTTLADSGSPLVSHIMHMRTRTVINDSIHDEYSVSSEKNASVDNGIMKPAEGLEPTGHKVTILVPHHATGYSQLYQNKNFQSINLANFYSSSLFKNLKINELFKNLLLFQNSKFKIQNSEPQFYQITIKADNNWLNDPSRAYPVIIDPTITHSADADFTGQNNRTADADSSTSSVQIEMAYPQPTADEYTVLLMHFNEADGSTSLFDNASTTRAITANGNASTTNSVTQVGLGNSGAFDGTGDYFSLPDSEDWNFGTGDFSIDGWIRLNTLASSQDIMSQYIDNDNRWRFFFSASSGLAFTVQSSGTAIILFNQGSISGWSIGTWYHIALARNGNNWNLYRNGVSIANLTDEDSMLNLAVNLQIGRIGTSDDLNGSIDELRITKGRALTIEEIKAAASRRPYAVYTSQAIDSGGAVTTWDSLSWIEGGVATGDGETLYSTASLVAQWDFNETSGTNATSSTNGSCEVCAGTLTNFMDTSGQDATATSGWTTANKRWGAGALMFDGVDDYVDIGTGPTSVKTVEFWVNPATTTEYFVNLTSTTDYISSSAGVITPIGFANPSIYVNGIASSTIVAGQWQHIVVTTDTAENASNLDIGRTADANYLRGTMDSTRFYSRALSQAEILSNYQAGNLEIQTRSGPTSDPNDGTWEAWKPTTSETQILSLDNDAANWHSHWTASTTIATSTDTVIKVEGSGSLKIEIGKASTTANTVALWHFEETGTTTGTYLYDETANNNDATTTGNPAVVNGIFGKALKFDGVNDYLSVNDSDDWNFGSGDFTVDFWVSFNNVTLSEEHLIGQRVGINYWEMSYRYSGGQGSLIARFNEASVNEVNIYQDWNPSNDIWYHIAFVRNGSTFTAYVDGTSIANDTWSGTATDIANPLYIGVAAIAQNTHYLNGNIDELRITKGYAMTADEIAETYRMGANHYISRTISSTDLSSKTKIPFYIAADRPGTYLEAMIGESAFVNYEASANTVLLLHGDEIATSTTVSSANITIMDSSASAHTITKNGDVEITASSSFMGNAIYFDGTGDYLSIPDSADWDFGSGNFSIDLWVYWNSMGSTYNLLTSRDANSTYLQFRGYTDGSLTFSVTDMVGSGLNVIATAPASTFTIGQWYHIAGVRNGNNFNLYVDGTSVASDTDSNLAPNIGVGLTIGAEDAWNSYTSPFNGSLDELQIIKGTAMTQDQIRQKYERGLRTHPITIDFAASLDLSNMISNSSDKSFTLNASTTYGISKSAGNLFLGDKLIVRENRGGTEYIAQGTVDSVNQTTGAVTVQSWDSGSSFPAAGFTEYASVFKWQREYFDITGTSFTTHRDAITNLTIRPTNGAEGRTVWLDDFVGGGSYLTASSSEAISSSNNRYLQYRVILSAWDNLVTPFLTGMNINYTLNSTKVFAPGINPSGGSFMIF